MELPIKPLKFSQYKQTRWMKKLSEDLFSPFLNPAELIQEQGKIMPLTQVMDQLNHHYIQQAPLTIEFEYYDQYNRLQVHTGTYFIDSPIMSDHSVRVSSSQTRTSSSNERFILSLNQIIWVTAITQSKIA